MKGLPLAQSSVPRFLKSLDLRSTAVSKSTVDRLRRVWPDLRVDASLFRVGFLFNAQCPVTGKQVRREQFSVFEGRVIGSCCPNCKARFDADPSRYAPKVRKMFVERRKQMEREQQAKLRRR